MPDSNSSAEFLLLLGIRKNAKIGVNYVIGMAKRNMFKNHTQGKRALHCKT